MVPGGNRDFLDGIDQSIEGASHVPSTPSDLLRTRRREIPEPGCDFNLGLQFESRATGLIQKMAKVAIGVPPFSFRYIAADR